MDGRPGGKTVGRTVDGRCDRPNGRTNGRPDRAAERTVGQPNGRRRSAGRSDAWTVDLACDRAVSRTDGRTAGLTGKLADARSVGRPAKVASPCSLNVCVCVCVALRLVREKQGLRPGMCAAHKENAKLVRNLYETCTKLVTKTNETAKRLTSQKEKCIGESVVWKLQVSQFRLCW